MEGKKGNKKPSGRKVNPPKRLVKILPRPAPVKPFLSMLAQNMRETSSLYTSILPQGGRPARLNRPHLGQSTEVTSSGQPPQLSPVGQSNQSTVIFPLMPSQSATLSSAGQSNQSTVIFPLMPSQSATLSPAGPLNQSTVIFPLMPSQSANLSSAGQSNQSTVIFPLMPSQSATLSPVGQSNQSTVIFPRTVPPAKNTYPIQNYPDIIRPQPEPRCPPLRIRVPQTSRIQPMHLRSFAKRFPLPDIHSIIANQSTSRVIRPPSQAPQFVRPRIPQSAQIMPPMPQVVRPPIPQYTQLIRTRIVQLPVGQPQVLQPQMIRNRIVQLPVSQPQVLPPPTTVQETMPQSSQVIHRPIAAFQLPSNQSQAMPPKPTAVFIGYQNIPPRNCFVDYKIPLVVPTNVNPIFDETGGLVSGPKGPLIYNFQEPPQQGSELSVHSFESTEWEHPVADTCVAGPSGYKRPDAVVSTSSGSGRMSTGAPGSFLENIETSGSGKRAGASVMYVDSSSSGPGNNSPLSIDNSADSDLYMVSACEDSMEVPAPISPIPDLDVTSSGSKPPGWAFRVNTTSSETYCDESTREADDDVGDTIAGRPIFRVPFKSDAGGKTVSWDPVRGFVVTMNSPVREVVPLISPAIAAVPLISPAIEPVPMDVPIPDYEEISTDSSEFQEKMSKMGISEAPRNTNYEAALRAIQVRMDHFFRINLEDDDDDDMPSPQYRQHPDENFQRMEQKSKDSYQRRLRIQRAKMLFGTFERSNLRKKVKKDMKRVRESTLEAPDPKKKPPMDVAGPSGYRRPSTSSSGTDDSRNMIFHIENIITNLKQTKKTLKKKR